MTVECSRIGYAYTPKLGQKPVYAVDVIINGSKVTVPVRADDTFEAWQVFSRCLGIPFRWPFSAAWRRS